MSDQGHNKRPLNPPGLNPSRLGAKSLSPPQNKDDLDERTWNFGIIVAAVIFAMALIGAVTWFAKSDRETTNNPPPTTTSVGGQDPAAPPTRKR
jgi:hypothetical protein